jgi:hypothetical protein
MEKQLLKLNAEPNEFTLSTENTAFKDMTANMALMHRRKKAPFIPRIPRAQLWAL